MMWTDLIDVMNFLFIANDMWAWWLMIICVSVFIWVISK
jgi:hypothetical protein